MELENFNMRPKKLHMESEKIFRMSEKVNI